MIDVTWQKYDTIQEIPLIVWDHYVSPKSCLNSHKALLTIEQTDSQSNLSYYLAYDKREKLIGISLVNEFRLDLILDMPPFLHPLIKGVRRIYRNFLMPKLIQTATLESYGKHFWFDESIWGFSDFTAQLFLEVKRTTKSFNAFLFRDIICEKLSKEERGHFEQSFPNNLFKKISPMPIAHLDIQGIASREDYLKSLKSRDRYTINKAVKKRVKNEIEFEIMEDYTHLIDDLYPMYLEVNSRAKEFKSYPLPKDFFYQIKENFKQKSYVHLFKKNERIVGFSLIIEANGACNIFLVGLDYQYNTKVDMMYNILLEGVTEAIAHNCKSVELGVSNYFLKERFGAETMPLNMLVAGGNPLVKMLLKLFRVALPSRKGDPCEKKNISFFKKKQ